MKCENLMNQGQSIKHAFRKQADITKNEYRVRLNASIDVSRYLLRQGLPFRGHDESEKSVNRGNFVELLKFTAEQNEDVSNQMMCPTIQKDIVNCFAEEVVKSVIEEMGHDVFGLLVDESADVSDKEQMAVVFRFVDKRGMVKERFMSITHVSDTTSSSLKAAIDSLFAKYGLSIKKVRGQGYDGASNMRGEFNGLRALISKETPSAYYVHCFAHQLQLVVVGVAKKHFDVGDFFDMISLLVNVVGASCKRKDMIRESYRKKIEEGINNGEINIGTGLNQEVSLNRPGNTRWNSHYNTLLRLIELFSCIVEVLEYIEIEGVEDLKRRQAFGLLKYFQSFDFVFYLQMMIYLLGLTENLSMMLQRRDQDILNAMDLVNSTKRQLQKFRDDGWNSLMNRVSSFCEEHDIEKVDMEKDFIDFRRPRKKQEFQICITKWSIAYFLFWICRFRSSTIVLMR
ncbi:PREDICTED: zinc finger MYM-type protein 1-like [Camelina sativa]|uniref:Zinc finger MYM-type protein 1-like n=1 Tax=Camelina sativa TaxID=90675 RepID=A0ABM0U2B2_CAMSA|nr:PREDICTED: zinc finger MYM-type protein 1-like [Camelina sativa]